MNIQMEVKRRMTHVSQIALTRYLIYNDNLAIRKTNESIVTDFTKSSVTTYTKHWSVETDLHSGVESETDEEAQQESYENTYTL